VCPLLLFLCGEGDGSPVLTYLLLQRQNSHNLLDRKNIKISMKTWIYK
jgi:hypothetical protein